MDNQTHDNTFLKEFINYIKVVVTVGLYFLLLLF